MSVVCPQNGTAVLKGITANCRLTETMDGPLSVSGDRCTTCRPNDFPLETSDAPRSSTNIMVYSKTDMVGRKRFCLETVFNQLFSAAMNPGPSTEINSPNNYMQLPGVMTTFFAQLKTYAPWGLECSTIICSLV